MDKKGKPIVEGKLNFADETDEETDDGKYFHAWTNGVETYDYFLF